MFEINPITPIPTLTTIVNSTAPIVVDILLSTLCRHSTIIYSILLCSTILKRLVEICILL